MNDNMSTNIFMAPTMTTSILTAVSMATVCMALLTLWLLTLRLWWHDW